MYKTMPAFNKFSRWFNEHGGIWRQVPSSSILLLCGRRSMHFQKTRELFTHALRHAQVVKQLLGMRRIVLDINTEYIP